MTARTRDEMDPHTRTVSDVLDDYLYRLHGISTSHTHPEVLIELLREQGIRLYATGCVNDTDGDGDCASCARNPDAPCRIITEILK